MPEGDSVWKLARRLDRQLAGRTIERSDFRTPRLATRDVSGRTVLGHDTHGKHLLTRLSETATSPAATLHSHLPGLRPGAGGARPRRSSRSSRDRR